MAPDQVELEDESTARRRMALGFFALWREAWSEEPAQRSAELAAKVRGSLSIESVFDVRQAEVRIPTGRGPWVGVYVDDSRAAEEARTCAQDQLDRVVSLCRGVCRIEDAQARVCRPSEAMDDLGARRDAIALSSADFHELCQWYRRKTPFHVVHEQRTPVLVVGSAARTLGEKVLVLDTGSMVADPVEEIGARVRELCSSIVLASDQLDPGEAWSWRRIEQSAAEAECDTLVLHPSEHLSLPLLGKHARLRHVLNETALPVFLV